MNIGLLIGVAVLVGAGIWVLRQLILKIDSVPANRAVNTAAHQVAIRHNKRPEDLFSE